MKKHLFKLLWSFLILLNQTVYGQKDNLAVIENVKESYAWRIVYAGFEEHGVKLGEVNEQSQTVVSGYYKYTNLLIDNRVKYQTTFSNGRIEIQFIERQYLSDQGWTDNYLPLSKGVKKKYIYPIAQTIRELNEKIASNQPPIASFTYNPTSTSTSEPVVFDASMSSDIEDDLSMLSVRWDWRNDGVWDTDWDTCKTAQHQFNTEGVIGVKMEIKDIYGFTDEVTHVMSVQNFLPCPNQPFVVYKGQKYNTVLIGNQCWIMENLNVGELIDGSTNMVNNGIIEKYSYDNNPSNNNRYGGLYQWDELMSYSLGDSICGICPTNGNWKIPTKNEYKELITYLGGEEIAGAKLKEAVSISWANQENSNSDASGFNALSGGAMGIQGEFNEIGNSVYFATTDPEWQLKLTDNNEAILVNAQGLNGVYVRCIKSSFNKNNLAENTGNPNNPDDTLVGTNTSIDDVVNVDPPIGGGPDGTGDDPDGTRNGTNDGSDGGLEGNPPIGGVDGPGNPPSTNCPKKEYLIYLPFNDKNFADSMNSLASEGYRLIEGSMVLCYFEKENDHVDSIKIEESVNKLSIETINGLAKEKWVVVSSFFVTYLIKDENAPIYEYIYGEELSNSGMSKYDDYFAGGSNIHDLNDIYGDKGWEMVFISAFNGSKSLFRRIIGSEIKYEYKSLFLTVADKTNNYQRVQDLGAEGWQYCSMPPVLKGKTGQSPIILKRRVGMGDSFSFQIIIVDAPGAELPAYINIVGKPEKEKQMSDALGLFSDLLNNYGQAGWRYEMSVDAHGDAYGEDKWIVVFQVPDSCKK